VVAVAPPDPPAPIELELDDVLPSSAASPVVLVSVLVSDVLVSVASESELVLVPVVLVAVAPPVVLVAVLLVAVALVVAVPVVAVAPTTVPPLTVLTAAVPTVAVVEAVLVLVTGPLVLVGIPCWLLSSPQAHCNSAVTNIGNKALCMLRAIVMASSPLSAR